MAIITTAEYKAYAGITATTDDTRIGTFIAGVSAEVRRHCSRNRSDGFEAVARTEDYESDGPSILLREWPVASVATVYEVEPDNSATVLIASDRYIKELETGELKLWFSHNHRTFVQSGSSSDLVSDWGHRPNWGRVRVTYTSAAIGDDLKFILYQMIDGLYAGIRRDPALASQTLGTWSVSYRSPQEAIMAMSGKLARFKRGGIL